MTQRKQTGPPSSKMEFVANRLRAAIQKGEFPAGSPLPPSGKLAKAFGVSKPTVLAALSRLQEMGLVACRQRVGVFVGNPPRLRRPQRPVALPLPRGKRSEQVALAIEKDISDARFRGGEFLPLGKLLQFRYQASSKTINAATGILERKGLVHRRGHAFVVGPENLPNPGTSSKFLLVGERAIILNLQKRNPTMGLLRSFEATARDFGIQIDQRARRYIDEDDMFPGLLKDTRGILYTPSNLFIQVIQEHLFDKFSRQLRRVLAKSVPVVLFTGPQFTPAFLKAFRRQRNFFPISIGGTIRGEVAGEYLASLNHRRVTYFSFSTEKWNKTRKDGFMAAHRRGLGARSEVIVRAAEFSKHVYLRQHRIADPAQIFGHLAENMKPHHVFEKEDPARHLSLELVGATFDDLHYSVLRPHFEASLLEDSSTAWVCSDHLVAKVARDFLQGNKMRVPGKISLISLTDNPEMLVQRITSYSAQSERVGYLAAHCLMGDIPIRRNPDGTVDCTGRIIERGSVARV